MKKVVMIIGMCLLLTSSVFSGCFNIPEELTQFSIMSFDIEPSIINQGEYANLSWVVISASTVSINQGIGNVALTGHRMIQPTQTTTYILTASNATLTKSANAVITVKSAQQNQMVDEIITDGIDDVSMVGLTGETTVITYSSYINIDNIDLTKATYTKEGKQVNLTLQVAGVIENRGKIIDYYSKDFLDDFSAVEYIFTLTTSEQDYVVSYSNKTGQLTKGTESPINLTSSDFLVVGDTLTIYLSLDSAGEAYEKLSVESTFIKANLSLDDMDNMDPSENAYLSDLAPNPPLRIYEAYAPNIGNVGKTIQFNGSVQPLSGQPPYSYRWDFGDQETSTLLNPTHTYTKAGEYTYTFTVTDKAGDTVSKSGTITII